MKLGLRLALIWILILPHSGLNASGMNTISVSLDQIVEAPRWMYDSKVKIKGGQLIETMVAAKKALLNKDRAHCLSALQKAFTLGKSLGPWLLWNQLQCAQLADAKGAISVGVLSAAIDKVDQQQRWLLLGPAASLLKTAYVNALLALAEQQVKVDRRTAWKTMDKLQQVRAWLNSEERAKIYRWSGELAFVEQNLTLAQDFLLRSLSEKESAEVRARVTSIRNSLIDKKTANDDEANLPLVKSAEPASGVPPSSVGSELGVSDEEREINARMDTALRSQDYLPAIEDGVLLLTKFPGSKHASEAADRILDIYLNVSGRSDEKFRHIHDSLLAEMVKVDPGHLARWANNAFARGNYVDAQELAEKSFAKYNNHPDSTKVLLLAGRAALACGQYKDAISHFEQIVREDSGTTEAVEATFRLGLLQFRAKRYAASATYFERLLALSGGKDYEYRALYWQWRAHQKIDPTKSASFAMPLINKYLFSYYGLRAKAEIDGGAISLSDQPVAVKADLRLLDSERLAWERLNVLLKAAWFKEAERELEVLPEPQTPTERIIRAKLWTSCLRYDLAIQNMNKAFDENQDLQQIALMKIVFPTQEYAKSIARESASLNISENWIRSLIRQESTFKPDAKSSSSALGLMQLLPATGTELAHDFKIKDFQLPDSLLNPEVNIKLGSNYLARMIHNFNGNLPLALAAYNAGPARLRRWLASRRDLGGLESTNSSAAEVEMWIDELPWEETSFYVKAILRNWLIYRLMDGSKVVLSDPIWLDAKPAAR